MTRGRFVSDTCTVGGCDRPHEARGLCGGHYLRLRRYGDIREGDPLRTALTPEQDFSRRYKITPTGCWEWTGTLDLGGYGRFKAVLAHRWSYMHFTGRTIPAGCDLDHLCRFRRCVNPAHLEAVTRQVNVDRGLGAKRTHCKNGHSFDAANTYIHATKGTQECRRCRADRERSRQREKRA